MILDPGAKNKPKPRYQSRSSLKILKNHKSNLKPKKCYSL